MRGWQAGSAQKEGCDGEWIEKILNSQSLAELLQPPASSGSGKNLGTKMLLDFKEAFILFYFIRNFSV